MVLISSMTLLLSSAVIGPSLAQDKGAGIEIKKVGPYRPDGGDKIVGEVSGDVSGVKPATCQCKVVVYAQTNTWYVQPYADSADTAIGNDGKWTSQTHGGAIYAALLVKTSWHAPATLAALPDVGGDILARATKEGKR
jgi:hypothetical protein